MDKKTHKATLELKADGAPGEFRATFATFNVIDLDRDVTIPGAFKDGQEVRIAAWGHNWGVPAIGKGTIAQDDARAWVDGAFFLDTQAGKDTYLSVKALGGLQEWSYGFDVTEQSFGEFEGQEVRFLRGLDVHEVSPVMLGAGVGTGTDTIKAAKDANLAEVRKAAETLGNAAAALSAALDRAIGSAEGDASAKAEAGDAGKAEGDDASAKDGVPVVVLTPYQRAELELLTT